MPDDDDDVDDERNCLENVSSTVCLWQMQDDMQEKAIVVLVNVKTTKSSPQSVCDIAFMGVRWFMCNVCVCVRFEAGRMETEWHNEKFIQKAAFW